MKKGLRDIDPSSRNGETTFSSDHISSGIPVPKQSRVQYFSDAEWEVFCEEYASTLDSYHKVQLRGGAGDQGLDIVGFIKDSTFEGGWDNYQCKFYKNALTPSNVWLEFGKIIYYSFIKEYPAPHKYYFVAPKGIGTKLANFLANPLVLKENIRKEWCEKIEGKISTKFDAPLVEDLLVYFENFNFSIFDSISVLEMIKKHANTPFHSVVFGGGLPARTSSTDIPDKLASNESPYLDQILRAYSECEREPVKCSKWLESNKKYKKDFQRQRERFYSAEALRNFSRDSAPIGTFNELQEEVFHGTIDVCERSYDHGFDRLNATMAQAASIPITSLLCSRLRILDKQGICHQLVNDAKLYWVEDE